jgi:hypothetical protein
MSEKRAHPRVVANLPLRLGPLASASVRDISLTGVRCVTPDPLTPMTVVALRLELPTGRESGDDWVELPCEGVVVRCRVLEENGDSKYESAILFQDMDESDQKILSSFVDRRLNS